MSRAITQTKSFMFEYEHPIQLADSEDSILLIVEAHHDPADWEFKQDSINILGAHIKGTSIVWHITPALEDKLIEKAWKEI